MAKTKKEPSPSKRSKTYDPKLQVKGSFADIMQAVVKDAKSKDGKKNKK